MNGKWRGAVISGRKKTELRSYFEKTGVPWIYEKEKPEVHEASTYNRKPKTTKFENNYEIKLANVRKALSTQEERLEKLRAERIINKPWTGYDKIIVGVLKGLNAAE